MQDCAGRGVEAPVMALAWLVVGAADFCVEIFAEEQRADAAMRDDGEIATLLGLHEDAADGGGDARLRMRSGLPTANALVGMREKLVCDRFEFGWRQEAGGAAVVLVQIGFDADGAAARGGEDFRRFDRLGFGAAPDLRDVRDGLRLRKRAHARGATLRQAPLRHRDCGIDADFGMRDEENSRHGPIMDPDEWSLVLKRIGIRNRRPNAGVPSLL